MSPLSRLLVTLLLALPLPLSAQTQVTVHKLETFTLQKTLSLVGTIAPKLELRIQSKRGGRVQEIHVRENEQVNAQALLLTLEHEEMRLQTERAEIQQALRQNAWRDSKEALNDAQRRLRQEEQLFERGTTTRSQYDAFQLQATRAALAVESARLNMELADKEAALQRQQLEDFFVNSPAAGRIVERLVEVGDVISAGSPLFHLMQLDEVEIQVGVPEEEIPTLRAGQKISFQTAGFPGEEFAGKVLRIGWSADPQTRRFPVTLLAPNPNRKLRAGMTAQVEIPLQIQGLIRAPSNAIRYDNNQAFVLLVQGQQLERRNITVGGTYQGQMLIYGGGIGAGDLIVNSRERLTTGMKVNVLNP
jgi:RND family efflux transporter MFP subunit